MNKEQVKIMDDDINFEKMESSTYANWRIVNTENARTPRRQTRKDFGRKAKSTQGFHNSL